MSNDWKKEARRVITERITNQQRPSLEDFYKEVAASFEEGNNAVYIVIQAICPECNKLVRLQFAADSKAMKVSHR